MEKHLFKLSNFIVCDEIRQEITKKHILIGVYDSLLILKTPDIAKLGYFQNNLAIYATFRCDDSFKEGMVLLSISNQLKELGHFQLQVQSNPVNRNISLALNIPNIQIPVESEFLAFEVKIFQGDSIICTIEADKINLSFVSPEKFPQNFINFADKEIKESIARKKKE